VDYLKVPVPLAVVDTATARVALNPAFATLLGLDPDDAADLPFASIVAPDDWPTVERVLVGVTSGIIESCQGRGRLLVADGSEMEVLAWMRPLDEHRPSERALLAVTPAEGNQPSPEPWLARVDMKCVALGALDHEWRFTEISPDAAELVGWDVAALLGTPLQSIVHPEDVPLLLLTLGRSGSERRAVASRLRVRGWNDDWVPVRCAISPLCDHSPARFGFALWLLPVPDRETSAERAAQLEGHLVRIAAEVQAAGVTEVGSWRGAWWSHPALRGLTDRQMTILRMVVAGERISAIASTLFVSESTVRNHLSAIYRRVGVRSQAELLALLIVDDGTRQATLV
jgi:PAS domain S-box-containing protein